MTHFIKDLKIGNLYIRQSRNSAEGLFYFLILKKVSEEVEVLQYFEADKNIKLSRIEISQRMWENLYNNSVKVKDSDKEMRKIIFLLFTNKYTWPF
jgi:hypothetical protein